MDIFIQPYLEYMLSMNCSEFVTFLLWYVIEFVFLLVLFAVIFVIASFVERKIFNFYNKTDGSLCLLQKFFSDSIKLFFKESITPENSDKLLFWLAPVINFSSILFLCAFLPFSMSFLPIKSDIGILFYIVVLMFYLFSILLAGISSNNKYSVLGALRYCLQFILVFIPLLFSVISIVILAGSMSFVDIVTVQHNYGILTWFIFPSFIGFVVYFISSIAIMNKIPSSFSGKENEIGEGYLTEYSGMKLFMFRTSKNILTILLCIFAVLLFFGGYMPPLSIFIADFFEKSQLLYSVILTCEQTFWLLLKTFLLFSTVIFIEKSMPKYRVDKFADFVWKVLVSLSIVNILIVCLFKLGGLYVL